MEQAVACGLWATGRFDRTGQIPAGIKRDRPEAKITFVDMLVKLLPTALADHPALNSAIVDDEIVFGDNTISGWPRPWIAAWWSLWSGDNLIFPNQRPLQKVQFGSRSRRVSFLTAGILGIFRGLKNEPNKEIVPKGAFCRGLNQHWLPPPQAPMAYPSYLMVVKQRL